MRILLAQLAPQKANVTANTDRLVELVTANRPELAVFPELYLSGYRVGDRVHALALRPGDPIFGRLQATARSTASGIVVGAPVASSRPGEVHNAAVFVGPHGAVAVQVKRFLPTYGPFEEGSHFTPTDTSTPAEFGAHRVGLQVCYDAFFPEVSRDLALAGADLLVAISAAPVTSRRLFEKVLPARAVENAAPLVYVNRVGVEDGVVFGGGSAAYDPRGEPVALSPVDFVRREPEEGLWTAELDPADAARWRPFRPVLRDIDPRPGHPPTPSGRTDHL